MSSFKINDISKKSNEALTSINAKELEPLPFPYDNPDDYPGLKKLSDSAKEKFASSLDEIAAVNIPHPKNEEEEKQLVESFLSGLNKLFSIENNWTFLQPLMLSMEHCARCNTCNDDCQIYQESGYQEIYRPNYRSELLRRLYFKYVKPGNKLFAAFQNGKIELNWTLISRLIELSYRCTMCRRCAQSCPVGVDNGLVTHELRKLFSQEMGIAPKELHEKGSLLQLNIGSTTGMKPKVVKDNMEFIDEDISERIGIKVENKWDIQGADVLLIHNAGEILSWPENPAAFAILLDAAGISWTLSSEALAYDGVNYGLFYDDVQLSRILIKHIEAAKKLGVKKILMGECGHESKVFSLIGERIVGTGIKVENALTFMEHIVFSGKIKFDPSKNNFPVTLHDPCNLVRIMGVVEPQRRILRYLAPEFREMAENGVHNYCCGGGSGFAIISGSNFTDWKIQVSGRRKFRQILEAFTNEDLTDPSPKYICAPCSNCKGQIRDILDFYGARQKSGLYYGGLVELIVNAMEDLKVPFIDFENMM